MNTKVLYALCELLSGELEEEVKKAEKNGLNLSSLEVIDKLTHALKSVKTTLAIAEQDGMSSRSGGSSYGYYAYPNSYDGYSRDDGSYRRGRDSMGRYSFDGENLGQELQRLIGKAPTPQIRMEMEHLAQQINNAM